MWIRKKCPSWWAGWLRCSPASELLRGGACGFMKCTTRPTRHGRPTQAQEEVTHAFLFNAFYLCVLYFSFLVLAVPNSMQCLSSLTKDQTCAPAAGELNQPLGHQEIPTVHFKGSGASTLLPAALAGAQSRATGGSSSHLAVAPSAHAERGDMREWARAVVMGAAATCRVPPTSWLEF